MQRINLFVQDVVKADEKQCRRSGPFFLSSFQYSCRGRLIFLFFAHFSALNHPMQPILNKPLSIYRQLNVQPLTMV